MREKVYIAVINKAHALVNLLSPTAKQLQWALEALVDPEEKTSLLLCYGLSKNAGLSLEAIMNVNQAQIDTVVNQGIDRLVVST